MTNPYGSRHCTSAEIQGYIDNTIVNSDLVFVAGHLLNTALGLVGGALQSLRLQYVEFFTKFYKGGGRKYHPFGMIKRFTED